MNNNTTYFDDNAYLTIDYNFSNISYQLCEKKQYFTNARAFLLCYNYFYRKSWLSATIQLLICIGTVIFNSLVMVFMIENSEKITKFDQIIFGHSMIDGITGIIDSSLYHVYSIFGYWPIGQTAALVWVAYDNMQNVITCSLMMYASYAKLRSIQNPRGFKQEILLKKPYQIMIIIWAIGIVTWIPLTYGFNINLDVYKVEKSIGLLYLDSVANIFTWLLPLIMTLIISIRILILLTKRERKKAKVNKSKIKSKPVTTRTTSVSFIGSLSTNEIERPNKNKTVNILAHLKSINLSPRTKLGIIMGTFLFQWLPPAIFRVLNPFVTNIPYGLNLVIHWMTYSVCCSDPIFILLLNPNISCKKKPNRIIKRVF